MWLNIEISCFLSLTGNLGFSNAFAFWVKCFILAVPVNTVEIAGWSAANLYPAETTESTSSCISQFRGSLSGKLEGEMIPSFFHSAIVVSAGYKSSSSILCD